MKIEPKDKSLLFSKTEIPDIFFTEYLPLANGDYIIALYLHEPYRQDFFQAPNCQSMHIEGFYKPYAHTIGLPEEGFIGLESV